MSTTVSGVCTSACNNAEICAITVSRKKNKEDAKTYCLEFTQFLMNDFLLIPSGHSFRICGGEETMAQLFLRVLPLPYIVHSHYKIRNKSDLLHIIMASLFNWEIYSNVVKCPGRLRVIPHHTSALLT
jgi:hypothetical protein